MISRCIPNSHVWHMSPPHPTVPSCASGLVHGTAQRNKNACMEITLYGPKRCSCQEAGLEARQASAAATCASDQVQAWNGETQKRAHGLGLSPSQQSSRKAHQCNQDTAEERGPTSGLARHIRLLDTTLAPNTLKRRPK